MRLLVLLMAMMALGTACSVEVVPATPSAKVQDLQLGGTADVPGLTITVYAADDGFAHQFGPPSGRRYYAVEVEACAKTEPAEVNPADFEIHMEDDTRFFSAPSKREPGLRLSILAPGDCTRGWITFEIPENGRPKYVVYTDFWVQPAVSVKWRLE